MAAMNKPMRSSSLALIAPMVFFGLGVLGFGYYFAMPGMEGPFKDNMVPELIGFCLEGFFMVGLLSLLQSSRERAHKRELWLSLRGSVRGILSALDLALLPANAAPASTLTLEQDPKVVRRFMRELQSIHLELSGMLALKREAIDALGLVRDMIPIAAQLSARHMRWWIAIVDSMRHLSQAQTREALEQSIYKLLENLEEFDRV